MTNDVLNLMEKRKMCKRENSINKKEINKNIERIRNCKGKLVYWEMRLRETQKSKLQY